MLKLRELTKAGDAVKSDSASLNNVKDVMRLITKYKQTNRDYQKIMLTDAIKGVTEKDEIKEIKRRTKDNESLKKIEQLKAKVGLPNKINGKTNVDNVKREYELYDDRKHIFVDYKDDEETGISKPISIIKEFKHKFSVNNNQSIMQVLKENKQKLRDMIKTDRQAQRELSTTTNTRRVEGIGDVNYDLVVRRETGQILCHKEGGTFLKIKQATQAKTVLEAKKPTTKDHYVGLEIEFISKKDKANLAIELFSAGVGSYCHLHGDGSVNAENDYPFAHELNILVKEKECDGVLKTILEVINKAGSKVNKSCGLHVHLDMRNRTKEKCFTNLVRSQSILYAMNSKQRLTGQYSYKVDSTDFDAVARGLGGKNAHYAGVNTSAYGEHGTIEIRMHSGSINFEKISNWVKILAAIVNSDVEYKTATTKPETFCERFSLDNKILEYIKARIDIFKDKVTKEHTYVEEIA